MYKTYKLREQKLSSNSTTTKGFICDKPAINWMTHYPDGLGIEKAVDNALFVKKFALGVYLQSSE